MKKLLIASAALAMVAGTAQAQSSVTVYGVIDVGYNSLETTTAGNVKAERSRIVAGDAGAGGESASSRIGFRGTEDLGGGLKANFVIETNIGAQNTTSGTGATNIGDRAFWAGLQDAKLGELRIGRQDTFGRTVWLSNDQLAFANVVGNLAHSNAGHTIDGAGTSTDTALSSFGSHTARLISANYLSPRMNGVQFNLGLMSDTTEGTGAAKVDSGSGSQVGLNYVAGKLTAGVAYLEAKTTTQTSNALTSNLKTKETVGAASYDLGVAKVAYIYNKRDIDQGVAAAGFTGQLQRESHSFSVSAPVGAKTVLRAGYGFGEYKPGAASAYNGDLKGMQAAVNYNLSKRTMAYVIYGDESREVTAATKAKTKEYSVGVRHTF
jgi:predicted porin